MPRVKMDVHLARAYAMDEANRNMRKGGRKIWNEDDYNIASKTYNDLVCLLLTDVEEYWHES